MNILILSCGTRNTIIQYFRASLAGEGKVIAADCSRTAPALYEADRFYVIPRITSPDYLPAVMEICKKEQISGVLSLIDPELSILADAQAELAQIGTKVIGSSAELCKRSLNKWEMFQWLKEHHYPCARTYIDKNEFYRDQSAKLIDYPVFIKPICGSASISIYKAEDRETVDFLFRKADNLMILEYFDGQEIGADCYIDMLSGEVVSIFTKKKLVMRAGETDKAVSFRDPKLFELVARFAAESGFRAAIDIDIFEKNGVYYISEVNPRFGGGYPHAYACGADFMKLIVNNLKGASNTARIGDYEEDICMMKYNEIQTIRSKE